MNPQDKRLIFSVGFTLACKIAVIACLGFLFFSSDDRIDPDAQSVSQFSLADNDAQNSSDSKP